jgi:hypothetical protein
LRAAPDGFLAKRVFQRGFRGPDFGGHGVGVGVGVKVAVVLFGAVEKKFFSENFLLGLEK